MESLLAAARELESAEQKAQPNGDQTDAPVDELQAQVARLNQENMELASRLAEAEEMNSAMMNMYVSSYQLHATLDPERVVNIIKEIVINFVGGEEFAVLLRNEETEDFIAVAGEDHESRYPTGQVLSQGVLGAVVA